MPTTKPARILEGVTPLNLSGPLEPRGRVAGNRVFEQFLCLVVAPCLFALVPVDRDELHHRVKAAVVMLEKFDLLGMFDLLEAQFVKSVPFSCCDHFRAELGVQVSPRTGDRHQDLLPHRFRDGRRVRDFKIVGQARPFRPSPALEMITERVAVGAKVYEFGIAFRDPF
jgi:hypothetical protein